MISQAASLTSTADIAKLWQRLDNDRLREFLQADVMCLRLDLLNQQAPGNKLFKLNGYLRLAALQGVRRIVSFGGAWSNHLHALAAIGRLHNIETVGLVRGELQQQLTPTLTDAQAMGMRLVPVSRADYRRKDQPDYLATVMAVYGPCLIVPEGGAGSAGVTGCLALADLVRSGPIAEGPIVLGVGTGTTLAGLVAGLDNNRDVIGISALKGAADLPHRVRSLLCESGYSDPGRWCIEHDFHCGGFARANAGLKAFMLEFEASGGPPLEPVYTGKAMFALRQMVANGRLSAAQPITFIHTGGLQGRRGYSWLKPINSTES
ncbi:MAG: pyridoxal-phosphate dependent enzyme [Halioglobus sp.]